MAESGSLFTWTKGRADAAVLVAEDELSDRAIAEKLGIGERTLYHWKEHPDFQARVASHVATLEASVLKFAVAKRRYRMGVYDDTERRLAQVADERALDPTMQDVPGGKSGLVVRQVKVIGSGRDAQIVEEYAVDTGYVRQRNQNLEQAAKDANQWADKSVTEVTGKDGGDIIFTIKFDRITDEEQEDHL